MRWTVRSRMGNSRLQRRRSSRDELSALTSGPGVGSAARSAIPLDSVLPRGDNLDHPRSYPAYSSDSTVEVRHLAKGQRRKAMAQRKKKAAAQRKKAVTVQRKYFLSEKDLPTKWYNIQADLPAPLPPIIHPGTGKPIGPQDLAPLFPMQLIKQEVSQERWIEIPQQVREVYRLWRPTPLYRAVA